MLFSLSDASGQLLLKSTTFDATLLINVDDGSTYPFTFASPKSYRWVPKLRIIRDPLLYETQRCDASLALAVEPIPSVARVTGVQSTLPAYGFYVASSDSKGVRVRNHALVYRYVFISSSNYLFSINHISSVEKFALLLSGNSNRTALAISRFC